MYTDGCSISDNFAPVLPSCSEQEQATPLRRPIKDRKEGEGEKEAEEDEAEEDTAAKMEAILDKVRKPRHE